MEKKYVGLANGNGQGQAPTLNKLDKDNDLKRHSKNIAAFLAQQAGNVLENRHNTTQQKPLSLKDDFDVSSRSCK